MRQTGLFRTVKAAALYHMPIKSYSRNTHAPSFLKRAVEDFKEKSTTIKLVHVRIPTAKVFLLLQLKVFEIFCHHKIIFSKEQLHILIACETLYSCTYLNTLCG
jgi:hypothetical protein